mmetsp:Transcript_68100/g.121345  ORF Transcript_68100/g.121345 Transcript_68100/m.121345 type:complete len:433 (+) Transcript_68100:74-1372(+)
MVPPCRFLQMALLFSASALCALTPLPAEPASLRGAVPAGTGSASALLLPGRALDDMSSVLHRRTAEHDYSYAEQDEDLLCASWSASCAGCLLASSAEYNGHVVPVRCRWVAARAGGDEADSPRCVPAAELTVMSDDGPGVERNTEDECSEVLPQGFIALIAVGVALVLIFVFCVCLFRRSYASNIVTKCPECEEEEDEEDVPVKPPFAVPGEDKRKTPQVSVHPSPPPPPCLALPPPQPPAMLLLEPPPPTDKPALLDNYAESVAKYYSDAADWTCSGSRSSSQSRRAISRELTADPSQRVLRAWRPCSAPPARGHRPHRAGKQRSRARASSAPQRRTSLGPCVQEMRRLSARRDWPSRPLEAEHISAVRAVHRELVTAADLPVTSRRALLRRLQLQWHPDKKNAEEQAVATAVLQYLNANSRWFLEERELA